MQETPILFKKILAEACNVGTKTNTLRIMNPQPVRDGEYYDYSGIAWLKTADATAIIGDLCPYGQPGDLLWVKEPHYGWGFWKFSEDRKTKKFHHWRVKPVVSFDNTNIRLAGIEEIGWHKRSPLFLPKKSARTWLRLTSVDAIQLGDVTEDIARREGMPPNWTGNLDGWDPDEHGYLPINWQSIPEEQITHFTALEALKATWQFINGAWDDFTWVWSLGFEKYNR